MTHRSIEIRVPLLIGTLLVAAVAATVGGAYQEVRRAALIAARERLDRVTRQIADLLETSLRSQQADLRAVARDPALLAYAQAPGRALRGAALAALARRAGQGAAAAAVELWDSGGRRLLVAGLTPPPLDTAASRELVTAAQGRDSVAVGPLRLERDTLWFATLLTIAPRGHILGYLVERRHVSSSPDGARQITQLIGSDAALYIGNARGDLWTDFWRPVAAPPVNVRGRQEALEYARDTAGPRLARAATLAGAPWTLLVEFPRDEVLARARAFLRRASLIALLLLAVGATAVWAISRQITQPLRELTDAAAAIAAGDYSRRVQLTRRDELAQLGEAFNTMAERVGDAQRYLEREVDERTRELRASNAELEAFSYSVSHDLRAPLRAVDGFAHILLEEHGAQLTAEARRLLDVIGKHTTHMGQLIDDLLDFSRLSRSAMDATALDLETLARSVTADLERAEGDRRVEVVIGPLPPSRGDRALVRQALFNLIGNAFKFTRGRPDARVEIGALQNGAETVYHVRDNGVGFDQRYAGKLFGVFQRLHRADEFEGTGVGLALVQRIVQRHGGRVWAEGRVNEGATFYFTLPDTGPR